MNQEDFRRLVATRSSGDSAGGDAQYGGSRKLSAQDLESIRKLSAKKTKKKDRSREHKSSLNREQPETSALSQSQYRDRAAERRQGIQIAEEIEDLKELTRDREKERAPVVKGLDFALLAQLKREKERLEKATAAAKAKTQPDRLSDDSLHEPTFKTRLGRLVFYHALQAREEQSTKSELFLPGRMTYTFNVASSSYDSIPTTVQRSKEDCPERDDMLCGQVDELLISRIASALDTKRQQKSIRRKTSRHQDQEAASIKNDVMMEAPNDRISDANGDTALESARDSDDDDIFPDAGEYVPAYMREEERVADSTAAAPRGSYFSDLSASISAAEAAERRKEKEAEEAWRTTLKKAVIAQTEAEREKERKARAAKLAAQEDTYSECFPEYQGAANDDSDDEEATSKKKRKGAGEAESTVDEDELSRRKKQKHQNKLENDLHKISKLLETKSK